MTRSSPETVELLPCPFCDGEPQQKHGYWIECKKCGAGVSAPKTNINTMGVIARWNTRAAAAGEPQAPGKPFSFLDAMNIVERGFDAWKDKPHNAKWYHTIDGTPIPNDLKVNIAEAICGYMSGFHSSEEPQTPLDRQKLIDLIGYRFGTLVSGNNMPDMSGDPRARIGGTRRRHFDNACAECADAILALVSSQEQT